MAAPKPTYIQPQKAATRVPSLLQSPSGQQRKPLPMPALGGMKQRQAARGRR